MAASESPRYLDEKVKEMLRLIEEDADSFAQRAEMYYQKRPELVNLVEEFYRAYRSLAERYDRLTGEIRQNIPKALQVQYGLSCDSPGSMGGAHGGRHHQYSPLRRSNQLFENLLKKACQIDEGLGKEGVQTGQDTNMEDGGDVVGQVVCEDAFVESQPNSSDEGLTSSSSDSEVDNVTPLMRLRREIEELKESNDAMVESHEKALQLNKALESKVQDLEEGLRAKEEVANGLQSKVSELNAELARLSAVARKQDDEYLEESDLSVEKRIDSSAKENICTLVVPSSRTAIDSVKDEDCPSSAERDYFPSEALSNNLLQQVTELTEELRKQKLLVLETGEEKREAIRQLCFSMDLLKSEKQRLEEVIGLLRKRLQPVLNAGGTVYRAPEPPQSPLAAWIQLFAVGFKARPPFVAVAL